MTHLPHPVRRIRDDPLEDESVTLLVRAEDGEAFEDLATHGTVADRLRFATVPVPQTSVAPVRDLPGVEAIETANALALDPGGAGEDVDPDGRKRR